ncbi:MAG TPA: class I SAM-dependent methyltransferase [Rhizomicrobium sp.]|nr:class I SAM-dependent methyltransferase [Rhizomicrobium sp.]
MAPSGFSARIQRLARHVGNPRDLPALVWKNLTLPFTAQGAELRYDRQHGIDTAGCVDTPDLGLSREVAQRGTLYDATPPRIAEFLIGKIAERAKDFTFVDVGSGKGRVLLIAAQFPFRKVVGLEHSALLNEVAAENIRRFARLHPGAPAIEVVTGDATRLPLPDGPLVLFLYNPLCSDAMRDFGAAIKTSWQAQPRKIICIYYNPAHSSELLESGIFPVQQILDRPRDPSDRHAALPLKALLLETADDDTGVRAA